MPDLKTNPQQVTTRNAPPRNEDPVTSPWVSIIVLNWNGLADTVERWEL